MSENTEKMTAKKAMAVLKGELGRVKNEFAVAKLLDQRLVRAEGGDVDLTADTYASAAARVESAYAYAIDALRCFKHQNKSATKEAERLGLSVPQAPTPPATEPIPVRTFPPYPPKYGTPPTPVQPDPESEDDSDEF